jgi:hypothetical protein
LTDWQRFFREKYERLGSAEHCGLRIADCGFASAVDFGFRISDFGLQSIATTDIDRKLGVAPLCNPQSEIRNPKSGGGLP